MSILWVLPNRQGNAYRHRNVCTLSTYRLKGTCNYPQGHMYLPTETRDFNDGHMYLLMDTCIYSGCIDACIYWQGHMYLLTETHVLIDRNSLHADGTHVFTDRDMHTRWRGFVLTARDMCTDGQGHMNSPSTHWQTGTCTLIGTCVLTDRCLSQNKTFVWWPQVLCYPYMYHCHVIFCPQTLLTGFPNNCDKLRSMRQSLAKFQQTRWQQAWEQTVRPLFV